MSTGQSSPVRCRSGLSLNPATGAITGAPTTAGTSNFTVQVQDSAGAPQTASKAFALTVNPATLSISTSSPLPAGTVSAAYSQTLPRRAVHHLMSTGQ